ncbi:shikimate kinase [Methylopila sp. M107]|uniref:shikimate kinase n=1 Tax=Methylopila sp. M107 TaxID=1101190 RepID=UPI0012DE5EAA|nr:shikimate kinase [Methylopila sp. M107]
MQHLEDATAGQAGHERAAAESGQDLARRARKALDGRTVTLIGMMGAGKTSVGRRLAQALDLPFVDADAEIEAVADLSIPEIFEKFGEPYFRSGEARVISRLLDDGQKVLATGGGAWMNPETRLHIGKAGVSVWLRAEVDVLLRRVRKRGGRPLLASADPEVTLKRLIEERYPVYALADLTITSRDAPHEHTVADLLRAICGLSDAPPPAEDIP